MVLSSNDVVMMDVPTMLSKVEYVVGMVPALRGRYTNSRREEFVVGMVQK